MTDVRAPAQLGRALTALDVANAAQLACLLEVSAPKPGNVSPGRHFADARYEDFLASAIAIGSPLEHVGTRSIGATIRLAVEATTRRAPSNTNLGIILLLTPIARAALDDEEVGRPSPGEQTRETPNPFYVGLRRAVRRVLDATTVEDARDVYAAIRLAAPGGLGRADAQDVADDPTLTLLETMRLAADRDGIAHEYATGFDVTFGIGVRSLERARRAGLSWDDAVVETYLILLAARPDTHVARRGGAALAESVSQRARAALDAGGVRSHAGRRAIDEMHCGLWDARHTANPGTTADLTAAAIFVVLLGGGWSPADGGSDAAAR